MKKRIISLILIGIMTFTLTLPAYAISGETVTVDFASQEFYPLIKTKFGLFNSAYVSNDRWLRDINLIDAVDPASMRYEIGWGMGNDVSQLNDSYAEPSEFNAPQIYGDPANPQINFEEMDLFVDSLMERDIPIFLMNCYNPLILQNAGDRYTDTPNNMSAWYQINQKFAGHFVQTGRKIDYYEIWNEPDLGFFFTGTKEEFFEVYKQGATGVRSADADAKIGGPALAFNTEWGSSFLDYVSQNHLPLDFFSFHAFGDPSWNIQTYSSFLSNHPELATTELVLSEFNPYSVGLDGVNFSQDGLIEKASFATVTLNQIKSLLEETSVSMVNWAQFNDPATFGGTPDRCGIVNNDGRKKAAYNAFEIYADMPVDRYKVTTIDPSLDGMASADSHKAAAVIWNNSPNNKEVSIGLNSISFPVGNMKIYRIDNEHASFGDNPNQEDLVPTEYYSDISTANISWQGIIPAYGVVYITVEDGSFISELAENKVADVVKVQNYYFERSKKSYAYFDPDTWIANLSMVNEDYADTLVGALAQHLPDSINVQFETVGNPRMMDINSLLGIRIDYEVGGQWQKGVLFHGGLYNPQRESALPWGTGRIADQIVQVNLDNFDINFNEYAPLGWNDGRVLISFEMQNAGSGSSAKVYINRSNMLSPENIAKFDFSTAYGSEIIDITGNGLNGSIHNSASITNDGFIGSSALFNGTDGYITIPNKIQNDFSIGFWMKTAQTGGIGQWHSGQGLVDADAPGQAYDFGVSLVGNKLAFGIGGEQDITIYSQSDVNDGKWHYCTAVRKGDCMQIYVDGTLEAQGTTHADQLLGAAEISIGRINTGFNYFDGCIDELSIYNYALKSVDIQDLCENKYVRSSYSFDGDNIFSDNSGNQFYMQANQIQQVPGAYGNGVQFNGAGSYGTIRRNIMDDFTISFFLQTTQTGGLGQWYSGIGIIDADAPGAAYDFGISNVDGKLAFGIGSPDLTILSQSKINDGQWHHVAVTRARVSGEIEIYIDGKKETSGIASNYSLYSSPEIYIGRIATNNTVYFNGSLDELNFYNKVLDSQEIFALSQMTWQ